MVHPLYLLKWNLAESRRGKCIGQTVKYWYLIMHLDIECPVKQCYEWQEHNMTVRVWTKDLKEELYNIRLAFVWRKQQECNLRTITKTVQGTCDDNDRQNILARLSEMRSLTLHQQMNFCWGKDQVQNLEERRKWKSVVFNKGVGVQSNQMKDPLYV